MTNYTHFTVQQLRVKWTELINRLLVSICHSQIITYLIWYEQSKREKVSSVKQLPQPKDSIKL